MASKKNEIEKYFWDRKKIKKIRSQKFSFFEISEKFRSKKNRGMHRWMDADHRLINLFPSDQKHSTRNCIKFADVKYLALIVHSRGGKKTFSSLSCQNQGNEHQMSRIS